MAHLNERVHNLENQIQRALGSVHELGKRVKAIEESTRDGTESPVIKERRFKIKLSEVIALGALAISIFALWYSHQTSAKALHISERAYLGVGSVAIFCPLCEHPDQIRVPNTFPAEATAFFLIKFPIPVTRQPLLLI